MRKNVNNDDGGIAKQGGWERSLVRRFTFALGWFTAGAILTPLAIIVWLALYVGLPALTGLIFSQPITIVTNTYIESSDSSGAAAPLSPYFWLGMVSLAAGLTLCTLAHAVRWVWRLWKRPKVFKG